MDIKGITDAADNVDASLTTIVITQGILLYFMYPIVQYLWGLINSLQIIVLTVLFNMPRLPFNAKTVLVTMLRLVAFEIIETEDFYQEVFGFE